MGVRDFAEKRKKQSAVGVRAFAEMRKNGSESQAAKNVTVPISSETISSVQNLSERSTESRKRENQVEERAAAVKSLELPFSPAQTAKLAIADRQNGTHELVEKQGEKRHIDLMSYDVDAAKARLEELKKQRFFVAPSPDGIVVDGGVVKTKAEKENEDAQHKLEREIKEAEQYQKAVEYAKIPSRTDFPEKSKRTTANNRYDKAVYGELYNDKQKYVDALKPKTRAEYENILKEYGEEEADNYLMLHGFNDEGGYLQNYLEELSDEEKSIFNYILNTEGDEKAEEYLKFLSDTLTYRSAVRNYERAKTLGAGSADNIYGFFTDVDAGIDNAVQGVAGWLTDEEIPYTREQIENSLFLEDQKGFSSIAHKAITSGANMLPSMLVGTVSPNAGKALFFASAGGNARQEALRAGYTSEQANRYGVLVGAAEVGLESALGGIAQLGGKGLSNVLGKIPGAKQAIGKIDDVISRISVGKQTTLRYAANTLDQTVGEFSDEYLQEIFNPVFRNICLDEHNKFKPFTKEALESGLVGALMATNSIVLNAPVSIYGSYTTSVEAFNSQRARDVVRDFVENTSDIQREDVVKARDELIKKLDNRESIDAGDIAAYTSTLTENEIVNGFGISESSVRDEADIRAQLGNAENADAVAGALYRMQNGEFTESDAETVRNSSEGRALFSEYFDTDITESTTVGEISDAVRNVSDDSFREISYDAQNMCKSIRANNGHTQEVDTAFYKAYFEGYNGVSRTWDSDSAISDAASQTAYELGADAKASIGTFKVVGGASLSSDVSSAFSKIAKDMGVSITYGGKGSVANGGVRRGYFNSHGEIHIYEDAKVMQVGGKTLYKGEAAARIILGHELTHVLQKRSPEQYRNFADLAVKASGGENEIAKYMRSYSLSRQNSIDEIAADFAMQYLFSDEKTARKITKHHSKLAQAILDAIAWIRDKLGIKTSDTETIMRMYGKMYNEGRENQKVRENIAKYGGYDFMSDDDSNEGEVKNSIAETKNAAEGGAKWSALMDDTQAKGVIDSFNINQRSLGDYIYVQKQVFKTLIEEGFFTDKNSRSRTDVNAESGMTIEVNKSGIDETFNYDNYGKRGKQLKLFKLATIRKIPDVIKNGRLLSSENANIHGDNHTAKYAYIEDCVIVAGKEITIKISIRQSAQKNKFWVHNVYLDEKATGQDAGTSKSSKTPYKTDGTNIIPQRTEGVKEIFGFTVYEDAKVNEDLLEELSIHDPNAKVDRRGNVTVYHRTTAESAAEIRRTGIMRAKENALFFSSKDNGYASDYGDTVVEFSIPSTDLLVNDIFDDEVHFEIPLKYKNGGFSLDVSKYLAKEADSNESAFSNGEVKNSIAGSEKILEEGVREANAVRGTYYSLAETLRAREDEARRTKREFLPDIETTNAVAAELGALGLADGATMTDLRKAVYDAAVAMRGAFLERRVMNADAKAKKNTAAANKLLDAAKLIDMKKGETLAAKAEAIADALYQTNTSDRKTVKQLVEEYGSIKPGENPSRTVAVPKRTSPETNVSQTVRTVMEASVTPEDMLPTIEDAIENGDFSYETITDKSARLKARRKVAKDYQGALYDFHNGVRSGKLSKNQLAIGFELYNQAANAGTPESKKTAMDILVDIADSARTAGQSLQAVRMLKKMSPEWKLYAAERTARKMNEKLSKRQSRRATAVKESIENAMAVGREDAAKGMAKSVSKLGQGVPVEQWIDAIGELVSDGISSRMNPKTDKQRLVSRNVSGDLLKFAEDYLPKAAGSKKSKTAAERLADYFANKDNYEKAWDKAKQALREKYADNADALEALDRFLVGTLSYGDIANSSVAMSAIARAAIESDNSVKRLALRAKLGDAESVSSEIFEKLNETVKAEGDDAIILRDAIRRYVLETAAESASPNALQNKIRESVREVGTEMSEIIRSGADERAETLRQITRYLTENIGISEDAAQQAAEIIDENFTAMTEEKSRDALEAFIKDKPKSVRKTAEERFTELANMGAFKGEYNEAIAKKLFGDTVKVNPKLAEKFLQAKTEAERDEILMDIYRDIGSQIPSTFLEKWTAWRYLCMLFNPTTHIRNMAGNAGNAPLVMTKNKIALALEQIFIKDKSHRTKAMLVGSGDLIRAAESDFESLKDILFDVEKYKDNVNANKYIQEGRRIFKDRVKINGKGVLNTLYDFSGNALSAEDMLFKKRYYVNALASFCKARGITAEQMRKGVGLEEARAYAIREAQKATFNDANAFSNFVSGRSKNEIANIAKSAVLPFQRTPANILARGVEYSPVGLMKSLTYDAVKVYRGDMTGAEMIDDVSAGLTGTGLFALGAFLVSLGLVKFKGLDGGDDDKERKFEEMYGHQQYSIEVFGKSITLDWLAPESIPFFAGVNFMEAAGDGADWNDVLQTFELFTDPMMNMSMLQGLNDAMENAKWSETDPLSSAVFGMLDSLISQNLPTLAGKLERITQSDRMTTYVDKNIWLPRGAQRSLGKLSQKLPGIDYNQIPYIDAWGEKETNDNAAWRAFDQLLNPAYTDTVTSTPLEQELIRLSRSTDETDVFPQRAKTYINVKVRTDGLPLTGDEKPEEVESVKVDLNKEQYVAYAQFKGKMSKRIATGLIGTPYYQSASDDLRRDMVKRVYELSDAAAKQTVSEYKANGWEAKALKTCAETGMTEVQYIVLYTQMSEISGQINGETVANYAGLQKMLLLYNASLTDKQREALKTDFGIGSKVSNLPKNAVENKIRVIEKKGE